MTLWHHGGPHEYFIFSWWSTTGSLQWWRFFMCQIRTCEHGPHPNHVRYLQKNPRVRRSKLYVGSPKSDVSSWVYVRRYGACRANPWHTLVCAIDVKKVCFVVDPLVAPCMDPVALKVLEDVSLNFCRVLNSKGSILRRPLDVVHQGSSSIHCKLHGFIQTCISYYAWV